METYTPFSHAPDFIAYVPEKRYKPLRGELKDRKEKVYGLHGKRLQRLYKQLYNNYNN